MANENAGGVKIKMLAHVAVTVDGKLVDALAGRLVTVPKHEATKLVHRGKARLAEEGDKDERPNRAPATRDGGNKGNGGNGQQGGNK